MLYLPLFYFILWRYLWSALRSHSSKLHHSDRIPKIIPQAIALPKITQTPIYQIPHLIQADLKYKTYV